jgi:hypothetical protein
MSSFPGSVDLPPTPLVPWATRRVLHSVLDVCGWGSATAGLNADLVANDSITAAVERAAAEHSLVFELARPQGWLLLSGADGAAVRGSSATATTGTERSAPTVGTEETPTG